MKIDKITKVKSNLLFHSLYYAEARNKFAGAISASLCPGKTAPLEEMSSWWRAVGNTVSDLTDSRFEPQTANNFFICLFIKHKTDKNYGKNYDKNYDKNKAKQQP